MVGAGCFWGVEHLFKKLGGVIFATSGYSGGEVENPTYQQICSGQTGHFEAVEVTFNTEKVDLEKVLKYFFEIHNFEQENGQGLDIGDQYKSVIFYQNEAQQQTAQKVIQQLSQLGYSPATQILPAKTFYSAEKYHQNYYQKNGKQPYCHIHKKIF